VRLRNIPVAASTIRKTGRELHAADQEEEKEKGKIK
jgi:hypothetical protein